jgi:uridine kinase
VTRVVGLAGGTASGKTTLARALTGRVGGLLVAQDRFYRSIPDGLRPLDWDFDDPAAVDLDGLAEAVAALAGGGAADLPVYDFRTHRQTGRRERVEAAGLVVVEGLFVLRAPVRQHLHLAVFVDAPADLRLMRRIRRDMAERGRTADEVLTQYERTVRPAHERHVGPSAASADLVLDGTAPIEACVGALLGALGQASGKRTPMRNGPF